MQARTTTSTSALAPRLREAWLIPAAVAAGVVALAAVLYACGLHGIGLAQDGVSYLSAADALAAGEGLVRYDGTLFAHWPPLFPFLLALLERAGIEGTNGARWLNALAFAGSVACSFFLLRRRLADTRWVVLGALLVALSYPSFVMCLVVSTEPLFLLLILAALLALHTAPERRAPWDWLVPALLAALVCLQRYTGVVLIASGAWSLYFTTEATRARRLRTAASFALVAALPLGLWLARNLARTGTLTGARYLSPDATFEQQWIQALFTLGSWILPPEIGNRRVVGYAGVALLVFLPLGRFVGRAFVSRSREGAGNAGTPPWFADPLLTWVVGSFVLLLGMTSTILMNGVDERLLQPVHAPLVGLGLVALESCLARATGGVAARQRPWKLAATVLVLLVLAGQVPRVVGIARELRQHGYLYTGQSWRESPTVARLAEFASDDLPLFSNSPQGLYARLGRRSVGVRPGPDLPLVVEELERRSPALLVCFTPELAGYPCPLAALEQSGRFTFELLAESRDGSLHRVTRRAATSPEPPPDR